MTAQPRPDGPEPGASGSRTLVGGVPLEALTTTEVARRLIELHDAPRSAGEHVHLLDLRSVVDRFADRDLDAVLRDGRGWSVARSRVLARLVSLRSGAHAAARVPACGLLAETADLGRAVGVRHYLLGHDTRAVARLGARLRQRYPGVHIAGFSTMTRRSALRDVQERDAAIAASGAQIVWVAVEGVAGDFEAARIAAALPVVAVALGESTASRVVGRLDRDGRQRSAPRADERRPVVVVGQLPPPLHGSAVMTQRLVEALHSIGRPTSVVDRRFSRTVAEVGSIGPRKLLAVPSLVLRFARSAAQGGTVVLLVTTRPATFLLDALLLRLAARPAVLYVHTIGFTELAARGAVWRRLVAWALGRAARVVVLGPSLLEDVRPFVRADRLTVIPNCSADVAPVEHVPGARLLFLSNLLPGKGADAFVRLATRLQEERPDLAWRFDLAGAGDSSLLPPLPDGLVVHGRVEGMRKDELLRAADVLVMPSTYAMEAQPLVIVEAMSYGLPVVAYDNGGIRDLVDSSIGALVPRGDESALLRAVLDLVASPDQLVQARGIAGRRHRDRHSLDVYADGWRMVLAVQEDGALARPGAYEGLGRRAPSRTARPSTRRQQQQSETEPSR